jgi:hypothetical protein
MNNFIINSFIYNNYNTIDSIYKYIKLKSKLIIEFNDIKNELNNLIKNKILLFDSNNYQLTEKGSIILNDHIYYYAIYIINFLKKYSKKYTIYTLKKIRLEQKKLRLYLINNKKHQCILCDKKLPLCLLETAHIKPHCLLSSCEKNNVNIVEFMCRYCHNLYDNGYLGINNGILCISKFLNDSFDLKYNSKIILSYNIHNNKYFDFQYRYIFKK